MFYNSNVKEIKSVISKYIKSVNEFDVNPDISKEIWSTSEMSSFIHPRGHEIGWHSIYEDFYGNTMGRRFSYRDLSVVGSPSIKIYSNTAVVEFYWIFNAVFSDDNSPLQTKGRETQVIVKENNVWKIVHVHYSNMPVTENKSGF